MAKLVFQSGRDMDFIGVGRLCVDLNANEINRPMEETRTFTKYVGGSPANITVALAKLGMKTGFIGKVSDDQHGRYVVNYLKEKNIDTAGVAVDRTGRVTGLAFTEIKSPQECSILMYRDNVADLNLDPADLREEYIKNSRMLLISGTALSASPSREAVFLALEFARKHGVVVFFDLDYRPYSWKSRTETGIYYSLAADKCDVIMGTREEFDCMEAITGDGGDDLATAARWFASRAKVVVIKHGKEGSFAYTREGERYQGKAFPAKIVKTFGAGDSYAGAFIYGLAQGWDIPRCLKYASAAASIVISSHSCSDAMPTAGEIEKFIQKCESGEIYAEGWK
jgi:5-dehydro-2-deoxygluconokinase